MNERMRRKLEQLQKESQKADRGAKIPDGTSRWRVLPYKTDSDGDPVHFYIERSHYLGDQSVICGRTDGGECCICDWRDTYKNHENELRKAIASAFYAREDHWTNLLPIKENEDGRFVTGAKALAIKLPKTLYDAILENILNSGYADLLDEQNGNVLIFSRKKLSADPRHVAYTLMIDPKGKPIFKDPERLKKALASVEKFDETRQVPSADSLQVALKKALRDKAFHAKALQDYLERQEKWEKERGQRG